MKEYNYIFINTPPNLYLVQASVLEFASDIIIPKSIKFANAIAYEKNCNPFEYKNDLQEIPTYEKYQKHTIKTVLVTVNFSEQFIEQFQHNIQMEVFTDKFLDAFVRISKDIITIKLK
ncbi:hypothetical protein ACT7C7_29765 [Bacillus cereus]